MTVLELCSHTKRICPAVKKDVQQEATAAQNYGRKLRGTGKQGQMSAYAQV